MVLREDADGVLAIGQPSHAWISGQLARAWGNSEFGELDPYEEVCLAAEQHDVGMAAWDLTPSRNPATGLPHAFTEMPLELHLELWRAGPRRLMTQSRYAALLASIHGRRLYEMRDLDALAPEDARAVREFLSEQSEFQHELTKTLRADSRMRDAAAPAQIARNSQLVWTWDFLSLAICLDWAPCTARDVPTADKDLTVDLSVRDALIFDPWPFRTPAVTVRCEGRRLAQRFDTDAALAAALAKAPWESVEFTLAAPGGA
jgi:Protein of unknown function (DUF3891)